MILLFMKESFIYHVFTKYQQYCVEKTIQPNTANFLDFLLSNELITGTKISHFTIIEEFRAWSQKGIGKNKTQRVQAIAKQYGIHPNTVWNVLKEDSL
ncbi:MAG: transposase family protein [Bacteroidota bacterium]